MRSMLEQQDRMLFNILAQPGGANALKRMTKEASAAPGVSEAAGGGGFSDPLVEKMRRKQLPAEEDEDIKALARLSAEELQQVLPALLTY
jgi:type III secretion system FlhB-like substrate exporter